MPHNSPIKIIIVAILAFILASMAINSKAETLQELSVKHANSLVGTVEKTGHNDGPIIEEILGYVGLKKGQPYCMSTVVYVYHKAALDLNTSDKLPKIGRVSAVYNYALANPFKYKIIPVKAIATKKEKLQLGDIVIFQRSGGTASNFNGHTGVICIEGNDIQYFDDIEANTSSGKKVKDQGEGDGIWQRRRTTFKRNGNLVLKGFIRIKYTGF